MDKAMRRSGPCWRARPPGCGSSPRAPGLRAVGMAMIVCAAAAAPVAAWTVDEHRMLADSALSVATASLDPLTRMNLRGALRAPWHGSRAGDDAPTFASICAASAAADHSSGRYPLGGRTVRQELDGLSAARIDTFTSRARRGDPDLFDGDRHRLRSRVRALALGHRALDRCR